VDAVEGSETTPDADVPGNGQLNPSADVQRGSQATSGADVLWSGRANFIDGAIAIGGKLALTRTALIFTAHRLNLKTGTHEVRVTAVRDVSFSGINRISIVLTDGEVVTHVVFRRKLLAQRIREVAGLGV
jgi:hypothetical protein